ncbi:MAG: MaoC family dehydratase [Candidatus Thorarchaeota archaeon]
MSEISVTRYEDVKIGDSAEVVHTITEDDIQSFGKLSGDYNPIHFNEEWAKKTLFKSRIAHGILTAASISTAIGMHLPGAGTIYLGQSMRFVRPVRIGDTITTTVEVIEKIDEKKHIRLKTICTNQDKKIVLEGEALVTLMDL